MASQQGKQIMFPTTAQPSNVDACERPPSMSPPLLDKEKDHNRRYSLYSFTNPTTTITTLAPDSLSLSNLLLFNQTNQANKSSSNVSVTNIKRVLGRRRTTTTSASNHEMTKSVCQRCQRFEVDLTTTSDNLNATDAELKASRQVISLLQRQLELFRVEKEGLEQLIISQTKNPLQNHQDTLNIDDTQLLVSLPEGYLDGSTNSSQSVEQLGNFQKKLLSLIQTQLYAKDEEIVKLKFNLKESQNEKEQLLLQLHLLEEDNAKLKSENSVLNENLALRDQTIVSLSNEVFEQGNLNEFNKSSVQRRQSNLETQTGNQQSLFKAQRHIAKLIDTLEAHKKTNELLSSNVMKLTDRCTQAEKKEIETRSQCHELEAKCCQIQSKLLSLLKEIEQSSKQNNISTVNNNDSGANSRQQQEVICSESVKLLIKRLLEDKSLDIPLSWKEGNKSNRNSTNRDDIKSLESEYECDELGFYIVVEADQEKIPSSNSSPRGSIVSKKLSITSLPSTSQGLSIVEEDTNELSLQQQQQNDSISSGSGSKETKRNILRHISVDATKSDEPSWRIRWDNFIKDFDKVDKTRSKEFKTLLRSGVPQEYRCKVWKSLVDLRIGKVREEHGEDYYQSLLEPNRPQGSSKKTLNSSSKQIELDLLRTLPNNKHFETLDSSGTIRLRRVLTAYSEHNPKVGYCQGMNRLAAVALLVLPECEAFWCLVAIIDEIMPNGYYNDLWLAQVDSSVVMDFVSMKLPELSEHFRRNGIDLSLFAWFLTIFVDGTPPALFLRLWDSFLYEGDKVLFRVAIALLKMYEAQLLRLNNSVTVNNFLRSAVNAPMNIDHFFEIAFESINPLPTRSLRAKRQHNLQLMRSGFENPGRLFLTPSPTDSYKDRGRRGSKNDDSPYEDSSVISI